MRIIHAILSGMSQKIMKSTAYLKKKKSKTKSISWSKMRLGKLVNLGSERLPVFDKG